MLCDIHGMPEVTNTSQKQTWRVSQKTYLETILSIIYEAGNCRYNELWHHLSLAH